MENKRNAEKGTYNDAPTYCPVYDHTCPYYDPSLGICHIDDPIEDCDDFGAFFESWEDWEDS